MRRNRADRVGRHILNVGMIVGGIVGLAAVAVAILSNSGNRLAAEPPAAPAPENPLRSASAGSSDAKAVAGNADGAKPANAQPAPASAADQAPAASAPGEHPLDAALKIAHRALEHINKDVKDYTCVFIKQERVNGQLIGPQFIDAKIRQTPLSVYFKFLKPDEVKGREVIYVAGANNGKFVAHEGSGLKAALGALWLNPTGALAMIDNRYPIADVGIGHMTKRLIEIAEQDRKYGEVEVHFYKNALVGKRTCTLIEVVHPTPRRVFLFHKARVYIDDELQVPIHYEAYLWPKQPGQEPPLDESYTYTELKLNVGLTDADFDFKNRKYGFIDK